MRGSLSESHHSVDVNLQSAVSIARCRHTSGFCAVADSVEFSRGRLTLTADREGLTIVQTAVKIKLILQDRRPIVTTSLCSQRHCKRGARHDLTASQQFRRIHPHQHLKSSRNIVPRNPQATKSRTNAANRCVNELYSVANGHVASCSSQCRLKLEEAPGIG